MTETSVSNIFIDDSAGREQRMTLSHRRLDVKEQSVDRRRERSDPRASPETGGSSAWLDIAALAETVSSERSKETGHRADNGWCHNARLVNASTGVENPADAKHDKRSSDNS